MCFSPTHATDNRVHEIIDFRQHSDGGAYPRRPPTSPFRYDLRASCPLSSCSPCKSHPASCPASENRHRSNLAQNTVTTVRAQHAAKVEIVFRRKWRCTQCHGRERWNKERRERTGRNISRSNSSVDTHPRLTFRKSTWTAGQRSC